MDFEVLFYIIIGFLISKIIIDFIFDIIDFILDNFIVFKKIEEDDDNV